jgi:hypothetical protein
MNVDAPNNNIVSENLSFLCDLYLIFGLHVVFPFLDLVHVLIKLAQSHDVFVCNFINVVKVCQLELYNLYFDSYTKFDDIFDELNVLEKLIGKNMPMS